MSRVSVIIPVFDVEKFIERCARSLFEQTLDDLEYIFINDCTNDKSINILNNVIKEYPKRNGQIKIIQHPSNKGLPTARKTGLCQATGDYVIHLDSDDWMEPEMLEKMYATVKKYDADAAVCDYFINNEPIPSHISDEPDVNCRDRFLSSAIACKGMQSVWRFMVKREICQSIGYWPSQPQGEDITMVVQMAYACKDIRYLHTPLYHWRTVDSSMTHNLSEASILKRFTGMAENAKTIEKFLSDNKETERYNRQIVALKLETRFYLRPLLRQGKCVEEWKNTFPEINGNILLNNNISFRHKIEYLTLKYLPNRLITTIYEIASK